MHDLEIILQIVIFPRKFVLLHSYTIAPKKIIFLVIGYLWLANFLMTCLAHVLDWKSGDWRPGLIYLICESMFETSIKSRHKIGTESLTRLVPFQEICKQTRLNEATNEVSLTTPQRSYLLIAKFDVAEYRPRVIQV